MSELKIINTLADELTPYVNNAKMHSAKQVTLEETGETYEALNG